MGGIPFVLEGDVCEVLEGFDDETFDAVLCDPPYGLKFMGRKWDHGVPGVEVWREVWRVLKPGAMLMAFGGTRTHHRLIVAIEDAGFEIRDCLMWLYATGFPKSANLSKMIDKQEENRWHKVSKALDSLDQSTILRGWISCSKSVPTAGVRFRKSPIGAGRNTLRRGSARASVRLLANPKNNSACAVVAELSSSGAPRTFNGVSFVRRVVGDGSTELRFCVTTAAGGCEDSRTPDTNKPFAHKSVWDYLAESRGVITGADGALLTWLGRKKSSDAELTSALCATLADDLKRTILSTSKTFQNLDMTQKTDCVSATTATITRSTAASLISFTVDTLRRKAIDKAAGAEREKVRHHNPRNPKSIRGGKGIEGGDRPYLIEAREKGYHDMDGPIPATPAARTWDGYGTALKPAWEPVILAMKPLCSTFASNALTYGVAGLWIDGGRITTDGALGANVLQSGHETTQGTEQLGDVRGVRPRVLETKQSNQGSEGASDMLADLSVRDDARRAERELEGRNLDGQQGLRLDSHGERGVSTRTPAGHGEEIGQTANEARAGSPHKPQPIGQQDRESAPLPERRSTRDDGACTERPGRTVSVPLGRWPANLILDEEAGALLDAQAGEGVGRVGMTQHASGTNSVYGKFKGSERSLVRDGVVDSGGRSRFFYCTKVSRVERNIGLPAGQKCEHPTLKPLKLTEYLARLLLPPARTREREPSSPPRTLLVPFCGAGSEMIGGLCAGWDEVVGIDSDPKACEWAEQRIEGATAAVEDARQVKILHGP